jgi:hypothetical protein
MHNELRYQAKIQAIFDMPRKEKIKFPAFSPSIFFFIKKKKKEQHAIWKQHHRISI